MRNDLRLFTKLVLAAIPVAAQFTALLLCVGTAAAQAAPALPEGPAGDGMRTYLAALDSRDSAKVLAWLKQYDPEGDLNVPRSWQHDSEGDLNVRTRWHLGLVAHTGGFTIERIIRGEPKAIEAVLRERWSGHRIRLEFVLNSNGAVAAFRLGPMTGEEQPPAPPQ